MSAALILLHPEALRGNHPVYRRAPAGTRSIFVWDESFLRTANYSLKRLIFIYETLCQLEVEVIRGETQAVIKALAPTTLYVPSTSNPLIAGVLRELSALTRVDIVAEEPFAMIKGSADVRKFFQYWKKAEKTALKPHAGSEE